MRTLLTSIGRVQNDVGEVLINTVYSRWIAHSDLGLPTLGAGGE